MVIDKLEKGGISDTCTVVGIEWRMRTLKGHKVVELKGFSTSFRTNLT